MSSAPTARCMSATGVPIGGAGRLWATTCRTTHRKDGGSSLASRSQPRELGHESAALSERQLLKNVESENSATACVPSKILARPGDMNRPALLKLLKDQDQPLPARHCRPRRVAVDVGRGREERRSGDHRLRDSPAGPAAPGRGRFGAQLREGDSMRTTRWCSASTTTICAVPPSPPSFSV